MSQRIWGIIILAIGCGFLYLPVKTTAVSESEEESRNVLLAAPAIVMLSNQTTPVAADTAYILVNGQREVWNEVKPQDIQNQFYKDILSFVGGLYKFDNAVNPSGYSDFYSAEAKLYTTDSSNPIDRDTAYIIVNPRVGIQGDVYSDSAGGILKGFKSIRDNLWMSPGDIKSQSNWSEKYRIGPNSLLSIGGIKEADKNIGAVFSQRGRELKNSYQGIYNKQTWNLNDVDRDPFTPPTTNTTQLPLEGGVWKVNGDLTFNQPAGTPEIKEIKLKDKGTIWVTGNLRINTNLKYFDDKAMAGFYVEKDVIIDGAVGEINGIFLVRGKIIINAGNQPLKMNGVFVAKEFKFGQRQSTNASQFEIMVRRDSHVNTTPPPGFSQIDWPGLKEVAP